MSTFSDAVDKQFFQPFYNDRIEIIKNMPAEASKAFDLSVLTFWSSVIDFYGGLYYIGEKKSPKVHPKSGDLKLAHGEAFILFIEKYFSSPENLYGDFIYSIFRSGIVHQICPKKAHVYWKHPTIDKLLWVDLDKGNDNQRENKIAHLNVGKFQEMTYNAYVTFRDQIRADTNPQISEYIHKYLLAPGDGLEDGKSLDDAFNGLLGKGVDLSILTP